MTLGFFSLFLFRNTVLTLTLSTFFFTRNDSILYIIILYIQTNVFIRFISCSWQVLYWYTYIKYNNIYSCILYLLHSHSRKGLFIHTTIRIVWYTYYYLLIHNIGFDSLYITHVGYYIFIVYLLYLCMVPFHVQYKSVYNFRRFDNVPIIYI